MNSGTDRLTSTAPARAREPACPAAPITMSTATSRVRREDVAHRSRSRRIERPHRAGAGGDLILRARPDHDHAITLPRRLTPVPITGVLDVPPVAREKARVAGAEAWLRGLPMLLADLARRWAMPTGRAYDGGTEAYVAEAIRADGTPAVVKLMSPRAGDHARHEIAVLRLAGGD